MITVVLRIQWDLKTNMIEYIINDSIIVDDRHPIIYIVFLIVNGILTFKTVLAKSYPYSKAVHIPCQNSSRSLEKNERPLMVRMRLCDPGQAHLFPCHVQSHMFNPAKIL